MGSAFNAYYVFKCNFYYPERLMNSGYAWILKWNPLYCMIQSFRNAMFGEAMDMGLTAYAAVCSVIVLILGVICFYKNRMILFCRYRG